MSALNLDSSKCDQMARLLVQYFAIQSNENLPNSINICQSGFKILPNKKSVNPKKFKELITCQSGKIRQI